MEAFLDSTGHLLDLARSVELDRAANALDIARRYDDPWSAAAAGIDYLHALQGANHAELLTSIQTGHQKAADLRIQAANIHTAFYRLFWNLLYVHTSNFELDQAHATIAAAFQIIRNADPEFVPHTWIDHPRYRLRLPWHSNVVHEWLEPYWDNPCDPPPIPPDPGFLVNIEPYTLPIEWPPAQPLESPVPHTLSAAYFERQTIWPDPFLLAHWQTTQSALENAASPIARYAAAGDREALFSIESTRHLLHTETLLSPAVAIAHNGWEPCEASRDAIAKTAATVQALTGLTFDEALAAPKVRRFLEQNLLPRLTHGYAGISAMAGEPGHLLLRTAALWQESGAGIEFNP